MITEKTKFFIMKVADKTAESLESHHVLGVIHFLFIQLKKYEYANIYYEYACKNVKFLVICYLYTYIVIF